MLEMEQFAPMSRGCAGAALTGASRSPARHPEKMTALSDRLFRPLVAALIAFATASAAAFGLDDVGARASSMAARSYKAPVDNMPTQLRELDYDAYRDIRYRPDKALWRAEKLPFELMFFHQGRTVPEPVRINVIEPSGERAMAFDPALFD